MDILLMDAIVVKLRCAKMWHVMYNGAPDAKHKPRRHLFSTLRATAVRLDFHCLALDSLIFLYLRISVSHNPVPFNALYVGSRTGFTDSGDHEAEGVSAFPDPWGDL